DERHHPLPVRRALHHCRRPDELRPGEREASELQDPATPGAAARSVGGSDRRDHQPTVGSGEELPAGPSVPVQPEGDLLMNAHNRTQGTMSRVLVLGAVTALITLTGCPSQAPAPCQIQASANGPYIVKFTNTGTPTANCPDFFGDGWNFDNFAGGLIAMDSIQVDLPVPSTPNSSVYWHGK